MKTLHLVIIALTLSSVLALPALHSVSAHGICTGLQPRYVRLEDTVYSSQWIHTGQSITINGKIVSMTPNDLKGQLLLYSDPGPPGRWIVMSEDPINNTFDIPGNSVITYSITAKALLPGKYYISSGINLVGIGPSAMNNGCPVDRGTVVTGKSMCNQGLVPISKIEDSSYYCVKPGTAKLLLQRGWASDTFLATIGSGVSGAEYGNGTWTASYVVDVDMGNFDNDTSPVHLQTLYRNGTVYKDDTIPASNIPSDGIYQYPITVKGDNWASGNQYFSLVVSYHNKTQTVILSQPPPHP